MPPQVLPTQEDIDWISEQLKGWGFRDVHRSEFRKDQARLGLVPPTPRTGREAGFSFYAHGLTVRVWITWLREEGRAREQDIGWVLIVDGDKAEYFCHPIHRTKNFRTNLCRWAWITRFKVLHRPLCPECRSYMDIARRRKGAIKARFWECSHIELHESGRHITRPWDYGVPPKAKLFLKASRQNRARQRGPNTVPAVLKRKPWRQTRPG